jgi:hypothetical protein
LRCAWLIDQGEIEEAKFMLKSFVNDFDDLSEERDVEILVLTLSGLVN